MTAATARSLINIIPDRYEANFKRTLQELGKIAIGGGKFIRICSLTEHEVETFRELGFVVEYEGLIQGRVTHKVRWD